MLTRVSGHDRRGRAVPVRRGGAYVHGKQCGGVRREGDGAGGGEGYPVLGAGGTDGGRGLMVALPAKQRKRRSFASIHRAGERPSVKKPCSQEILSFSVTQDAIPMVLKEASLLLSERTAILASAEIQTEFLLHLRRQLVRYDQLAVISERDPAMIEQQVRTRG